MIAFAGLIGLVLEYITPLTIAPAVTMIGLPLFGVAARLAAKHWALSIGYQERKDIVQCVLNSFSLCVEPSS